jgi:hypothetical protein
LTALPSTFAYFGLDRLLLVRLRVLGIVRNRESLLLKLANGGLQLRHRRADVRQLDDVGFGCLGELTQFGEVIW